MKKRLGTLVLALFSAVIVASMAGTSRMPGDPNATLLAGAQVPREVRSTIERACRDCHSESTRFPWYSYIPPISWLINRDIERGRERLNFSRWAEYPVIRRERCLSEIANQVQDGGMPLSIYTFVHHEARLSRSDIEAIFQWTQAERMRLIMENAAAAESK